MHRYASSKASDSACLEKFLDCRGSSHAQGQPGVARATWPTLVRRFDWRCRWLRRLLRRFGRTETRQPFHPARPPTSNLVVSLSLTLVVLVSRPGVQRCGHWTHAREAR